LLLPREEEATTPEARSPFITPAPPSRQLFRENVGNGSPVPGQNYTKSGNLFVVNPSSTPRDSPTTRFQSNYQGDTRGFTKLGAETTVRTLGGDDQNNSALNNAPRYRGSSGVFPSIFATPLQVGNKVARAPEIKTAAVNGAENISILSVPAPAAQQIRSLFRRSKPPVKTTARNLGISGPVLDESNESVQPFARMPTIDLATAATNERERREGAAARSRLVASRPAPQPPSLPPAHEGLRRSISVKRKEMPISRKEPMPTIPSSNAFEISVDAANGSSTSASLSPGHEEVRRRSPRNMNNFNGLIDEKSTSMVPLLQRKGTIGLPSNPRSQRITMAREAGLEMEQTVMFINNIVYDDPGMVDAIINTAPNMYAPTNRSKLAEKPSEDFSRPSPRSAHSIIHRPRPYKRDAEKDRAIFPSEPSPRHKRSKSGSSIVGRKSMLMGSIGSPTQLPPLPPPPTSAAKLKRLLPNDTKSMTFDEKIELLFPAPPGAPSIHNRRSSVPSLPRVPSVFMPDTHVQSPTEEDQRSRRASKRTTIASFGAPDLNKQANSPKPQAHEAADRQTYRFSANTYRNLADEVGETWIPGIPAIEIDIRNSVQEPPKPEPEPVFKTRQKSSWTETTASISSSSDTTTYWGSLHSEIPPVDLSKARQTAKPTLIQQGENRPGDDNSRALPPLPQTEFNDGDEIMTVMLDSGEARRPILSEPTNNRRSFLLDAGQTLPGDKTPSPRSARAWHRRIGDELPTFSERKVQTRSRKMPPPTPLLLNKNGRQATFVVRNTEPSPIDSPERAIQELQAQLKRFEEPSRGSVGSIIRHLPNGSSVEEGELPEDNKLKLLENLEKEMGQQENQWQRMQTNFDRDSVSTVMSPPAPSQPHNDFSRESSQRSSRTPSRIMSRRARIRSSMTVRSNGEDSTSTTSTQSSDNSRASVWQQRLAEAQVEYLEKAPALLRKRSLNFLSVAKSHQLGSPTPPDSEESGTELETDTESESEAPEALKAPFDPSQKQLLSLWEPTPVLPRTASGRLWNPPYESSVARNDSPEPPARDVRPVQRLSGYPLSISSSALWSKPRSSEHSRPVAGLWGSKPVRPRSIMTRPVTQRPQRKSKRVTFLPDIGMRLLETMNELLANTQVVESPVPLPNKRDTLGIFQFPWGEKSDSAVYQPIFNPALLAGSVVNTKLDARSHQLEPDSSEYSSSFFDEYDEEHEDDIDPESDDEFDETTLWEIASLLKSRDVPSKDSLLPPSREVLSRDIIEDYDDESDFDSDAEGQESSVDELRTPSDTILATKFPIQPLVPAPRERSQLWTSGLTSLLPASTTSLPQPEESVWKSLVPAADDIIRSKPRVSETLPALVTRNLWTVSHSETSIPTVTSMWRMQSTSESRSPARKELLWQARLEKKDLRTSGLFTATNDQTVVRTTKANPAAINMLKKPRSSTAGLRISSRSLWSRSLSPKRQIKWTSKPTASRESSVITTHMWALGRKEVVQTVTGLFDVAMPRSDYRSTALIPAAINMTCKPRMIRAPLGKLTSTKLWRRGERLSPEHHWISESSVRPDSPSIYSSASSGESSPFSNASSVKSTSTKASSIWGSIGSAATWWESKSGKKSPSRSPVDDPKHPLKIALRQTPIKPMEHTRESKIPAPVKRLEALRESRVFVSRDLAETKAPVLESTPMKKARTVTPQPGAPVHKSLRHQHRPILAFRANWDEALAEAIAAGAPRKARPAATQAEWAAALATAISQSQPRSQRLNASPEMWEAALVEALIKSIATSHVTKYDPSIRHPVFFTENMTTTTTQIHPAAIEHVSTPKSAPLMWTTPSVAKAPTAAPLWSMETASKREALLPVNKVNEIVRKAPVIKTLDLPSLKSSAFWQPTKLPISERNWSTATKVKSVQTWAPRGIQKSSVKENDNSSLWMLRQPESVGSLDMFANVRGEYVKKTPTPCAATLPRLESSRLFEPTSSAESTSHWLRATSTVPETPSRSLSSSESEGLTCWTPASSESDNEGLTCWTPVSVTALANKAGEKMWESVTKNAVQSPTLFSNPHTAPWDQKKRQPAPLKTIESTSLWRLSMAIPESPRDWLVKRRFSRVEFRY
jgi:hypothetical protein